MSARREVWETLASLLARVEAGLESAGGPGVNGAALEMVEQELRRLGRTQFKANVLVEKQSARWEDALAALREEKGESEQLLEALVAERVAAARRELLEALLPAVDGADKAIASGQRFLQVRDRAARNPNLTEEQAILVSPADRAMLVGWLRGLWLVRERLLAVLEAGGVTPIRTVGHPFDPHVHVAVDVTSQGSVRPGTIVKEERRGYRTPNGVLRYAEVVVHRPTSRERSGEPSRSEVMEE